MDNVKFIHCTSFRISVIPIGGSEGLRHIRTAEQRGVIGISTYILGWRLL